MIDFYTDPTGTTRKVEIAGTYTNLAEAKVAAKKALFDLGYRADLFEEYLAKEGSSNWTLGDGTPVHARASTVGIETTPNALDIQPGPGTSRVLKKLFYVIQTTIYFSLDCSSAKRDIFVEGPYLSRPDAVPVAKKVLLDTCGDPLRHSCWRSPYT